MDTILSRRTLRERFFCLGTRRMRKMMLHLEAVMASADEFVPGLSKSLE